MYIDFECDSVPEHDDLETFNQNEADDYRHESDYEATNEDDDPPVEYNDAMSDVIEVEFD